MNATITPASTMLSAPARGWALFRQSGAEAGGRWSVAVLFVFFLAVALLKGVTPSLYPLALGVWWFWVPRIAAMHREARQARIPHFDGAVAWALLIAASTLLAAYLWSGNLDTLLMAVLCATAVLAISLMSLRRILIAYLALLFVVTPIVGVGGVLLDLEPDRVIRALIGGTLQTGPMSAIVAVTLVATVWLWRGFLRRDVAQETNVWSKPIAVLTLQHARSTNAGQQFWQGFPLHAWLSNEPTSKAALSKASRTSDADTLSRWLGAPFVPATRRQTMASVIGVLPLAGYLLWNVFIAHRPERLDVIAEGLVLGPMILVLFIARLHQFMHHPDAERVELALLPGLGRSDDAKRRWLRMVWSRMSIAGAWLMLMLVALLAASVALGVATPWQVATRLLIATELLVIVHGLLLAVLAGHRLNATPSNLAMLTGLLAVPAATAVFLAGGDAGWPALIATGGVTLSGGALWMRWLLARYRRRPHPFLQR